MPALEAQAGGSAHRPSSERLAAKRQESAAYWIKTADRLARRVDELEAELFRLKAERRAAIDELERLRHSDRALLLVAERDAWREKAAIFASAIGLARLHLLQGDPERASEALDGAVQKASEAMAARATR